MSARGPSCCRVFTGHQVSASGFCDLFSNATFVPQACPLRGICCSSVCLHNRPPALLCRGCGQLALAPEGTSLFLLIQTHGASHPSPAPSAGSWGSVPECPPRPGEGWPSLLLASGKPETPCPGPWGPQVGARSPSCMQDRAGTSCWSPGWFQRNWSWRVMGPG